MLTTPTFAVENLRSAAAGVWVGGAPRGDADWSALARLGVRTAVGVDGLAPDRGAAAGRGIAVVHVPLGYDGVDERSAATLARVARDAERPVYVYCHHGQHRGPAAAAIVCRAAGLLDTEEAIELLRAAGTSRAYRGLWRDVAEFSPPPPSVELPELVERHETPPLATAMAQLDRAWERVADGVDPSATAGLAAASEAMAEAVRGSLVEGRHPALVEALRSAESELRAHAGLESAAVASIDAACVACHRRWRDGG